MLESALKFSPSPSNTSKTLYYSKYNIDLNVILDLIWQNKYNENNIKTLMEILYQSNKEYIIPMITFSRRALKHCI